MKTIYRVMKDTVEVKSNSRLGDGSLVGRPFPRALSADEIEEIYFAGDQAWHRVGDFGTKEEAEQAAEKISISTDLYDWAVPFISADIVRVEEVEIDEAGFESYVGCWMFRCEGYAEKDEEEE